MACPKKKISRTRRDNRRSHHALKPSLPTLCGHCKQPKQMHRVCGNCGYYAGAQVKVIAE